MTAPDSVVAALDAIAEARRASVAAGMSAVVVPAMVVVMMARWRPAVARRHPGRAALARALATLVAVLYGVLAYEYARADQAAPARARLARAYGRPLVDALERYRADHRVYPDSLAALIPQYLSPARRRAPERSVLAAPFRLERTAADAYILRLRYIGPDGRPAFCEHSSRTHRWYCSGP